MRVAVLTVAVAIAAAAPGDAAAQPARPGDPAGAEQPGPRRLPPEVQREQLRRITERQRQQAAAAAAARGDAEAEEPDEPTEAESERAAADRIRQVLAAATRIKDAKLTAADVADLEIEVDEIEWEGTDGLRVELRGVVTSEEARDEAVAAVDKSAGVLEVDADLGVMSIEQQKKKFRASKWMALVFWAFALTVLVGALFVITRRNLIAAVMGMVGTFMAIAVVYAMLYAHFLAVIQVLVYAGAIMVLFVFVVMILNKPEDQPWSRQAWPGKVMAVLAGAYLLFRLGSVLWGVEAASPEQSKPPAEVVVRQAAGEQEARTADFGSTRAVGKTLFQDYLFPFEAISLVLLVAVVGALAVARPHHEKHDGTGGEVQS